MRRSVLLFLALAAVAGCGGSGAPGTTSGVSMRVQWPDASRLIPAATRSVQVTIRDASGFETFRVVNRPETGNLSTMVFFGLTPGNLSFSAKAFPAVDAQGVSVAGAQSQVTLSPGFQTNVTLNLVSTIDRIEIAPQRLDLAVSATGDLVATARDGSGNIVPLTASQTEWRSQDTSVAQVNAAGRVTAVKSGSVLVSFTDNESGKSASALVVIP